MESRKCDCGCGNEIGSIEFQKLHAPEALLGFFPHMLELCECGCTAQIHELAKGKCKNPQCQGCFVNQNSPAECVQFKGSGHLHESAFESNSIEMQIAEITCGMSEQEWREVCNPGPSQIYQLEKLKVSCHD